MGAKAIGSGGVWFLSASATQRIRQGSRCSGPGCDHGHAALAPACPWLVFASRVRVPRRKKTLTLSWARGTLAAPASSRPSSRAARPPSHDPFPTRPDTHPGSLRAIIVAEALPRSRYLAGLEQDPSEATTSTLPLERSWLEVCADVAAASQLTRLRHPSDRKRCFGKSPAIRSRSSAQATNRLSRLAW